MPQLIATAQTENSHYYTRTGEAVHGNLRDARKVNAYPSVTNCLNILAKPGLDNWKQETAILQSLTLPRLDGEADPDFAKRVVAASRTELEAAADRGSYVHSLAEMIGANLPPPTDLRPGFESHWKCLSDWFTKIDKTHSAEQVLVNEEVGYAGRVDLIADILSDEGSRVEVIDFKTRKFKKDKADSYSTDLYQLAAYAFAQFEEPVWCRNVYIDPTTGAICEKHWSPDEVEAAFEVFQAICVIWRAEKKYDPRERA